MKQIVRNFVFQTESLDGLTLRYDLRLIADKKPFENTAAIHTLIVFVTAAKVIVFSFQAIRQNWTLTLIPTKAGMI